MYMEGALKTGWIEKRSHYLKKWRKRWLVLNETSISTYKHPESTATPTANISINSIVEAGPWDQENNREFCFKIATPSRQYIISTNSSSDLGGWLDLITSAMNSPKNSTILTISNFQERKALSDISLISVFSKIKEILNNREQDLNQEIDNLYENHIRIAEIEQLKINEILDSETKSYEKFENILKSNKSVVHKIRLIQAIKRNNLMFKDFDNEAETQFGVAIPDEGIRKIISSSTRVRLDNPLEERIRRTTITRALKWRYTGERIDALTFTTSEPVKLTGVGICAPYKAGGLTTIKEFQVVKGNYTGSSAVYRHPQSIAIEYNSDESVFKIVMESPVSISKNHKYTVMFCIEGSHTYKCVDCMQSVTGPGHIRWDFENTTFSQNHQNNRCDTICGPIADFYYIVD